MRLSLKPSWVATNSSVALVLSEEQDISLLCPALSTKAVGGDKAFGRTPSSAVGVEAGCAEQSC